MISAVRTTDGSRDGFTLLELVLVLAISAMVLGGAVGLMIYHSSERDLKDVSSQIELMAKQARTVALLQQKPYALEFLPGKVRMLPLAELTGMPADPSKESEGSTEATSPVHQEITLPAEMVLTIRRWASETWLEPSDKSSQIWRFDPNGLCEPISVHLDLGGNYIENEYHPLTAAIRETFMDIKQ